MSIRPSVARGRLRKRHAWLIARIEEMRAKSPEKPLYFLEEETEALEFVLGILEAIAGPANGGEAASEGERVQRARDTLSARAARCTCERCPVHSATSSVKVATNG